MSCYAPPFRTPFAPVVQEPLTLTGNVLSIPPATDSQDGYMTAEDHALLMTLSPPLITSTTAPLSVNSGDLSIPPATDSQNGYMTAQDHQILTSLNPPFITSVGAPLEINLGQLSLPETADLKVKSISASDQPYRSLVIIDETITSSASSAFVTLKYSNDGKTENFDVATDGKITVLSYGVYFVSLTMTITTSVNPYNILGIYTSNGGQARQTLPEAISPTYVTLGDFFEMTATQIIEVKLLSDSSDITITGGILKIYKAP